MPGESSQTELFWIFRVSYLGFGIPDLFSMKSSDRPDGMKFGSNMSVTDLPRIQSQVRHEFLNSCHTGRTMGPSWSQLYSYQWICSKLWS